jgi:hypothetical protein
MACHPFIYLSHGMASIATWQQRNVLESAKIGPGLVAFDALMAVLPEAEEHRTAIEDEVQSALAARRRLPAELIVHLPPRGIVPRLRPLVLCKKDGWQAGTHAPDATHSCARRVMAVPGKRWPGHLRRGGGQNHRCMRSRTTSMTGGRPGHLASARRGLPEVGCKGRCRVSVYHGWDWRWPSGG